MTPSALAFLGLGLALLLGGAELLVRGASRLALRFGITPLVVGLTVVAFGTSSPELAVSVRAGLAGQGDIAVGNIVGSNIFNLLLVLGATALIAAEGVQVSPAAIRFDLPVMTAVAIACLPIFFNGHCIARWEGALFLGYYVAYTAYLLMAAADHEALPDFRFVMLSVVIPLTVVTLAVVTWRNLRAHRRTDAGTQSASRDHDPGTAG